MVRPYTVGKPFRFWCQKILPLVYDDSLSYYELLNKVVDYLNKVINNVNSIGEAFNELGGQFESLQASFNELSEMVDNYFDNLDVQQEINNKLDAMAEDGTLDALIQPLVDSSVSDAVSEWLEENVTPTGSAVVVDSSLTVSGAAADAKVTGDEIRDLKSDLNSQGQLASSLYGMIPEQTATGWCLNGTGGSRSYTGCNLVKYAVTEGQELYVILSKDTDATNAQGVYQFQDAKSVPTGNNSHLIGDPVTVATTGKITVPTGATYLIVSQLSSNKTNVVMDGNLSISAIKNNADKAPLCYVFPIWNVTKYGISINGKTIHVGKNGFGVFYNGGLYYIAATDRTTEYDFTAQYGNTWLVIDPSKLTNKGARQNPNVVMKLVTNSSLTADLIPVAYIFALTDSFDFFGAFRIFRKSPTTEQMESAIESATARATSLNPNFLMNMVGAHAGSTNGTYALNSMIGYKSAITNGDKLIEGDIRFSSDLIPVMFHDETLSTSNISNWQGEDAYVGAKTLAELQTYALVKNSGTIPTLEEFLLLCKKFGVIAELDLAGKTFKSDASTEIITQSDMLNSIISVVEKTGMEQSVVFTLSTSQARTMMGITGKYPVCISNMTTVSAINGIADIVDSFPLVFCSIGTTYTEEVMSAIRAHGDTCKAKAWTIDTLTDMDSAFDVGVAYALSNAIYQEAYNEHVLV